MGMLSIAELEILLKARDEASAVIAKAEKGIGGYAQSIERFARPAMLGLAAAAVLVSTGVFLSARAAIEDQAAMAGLGAAVDATGASFSGATEDSIMAFVNSLESFSGFSKVEILNGLQLLTEETDNVGEAMNRERIAVDFARGAHLDLFTASKLLGKVTDDTINVLARYGVHVDKGTSATELFALVQAKFAGQAGAFAGTVEGKWEILKNKVHDLEAEIGAALLPTFQKLLDAAEAFVVDDLPKIIKGVGDFTAQHPDIIAYGLAILGVVAALGVLGLIVGPIAAGLGLILSPITLIILGLTGLFIAWQTNFLGIQKIVKDFVLGFYKAADDLGAAADGIVKGIGGAFDGLGTAIHKILDTVGTNIANWISDRRQDIINFLVWAADKTGQGVTPFTGGAGGGNRQSGGSQDDTGPSHPAPKPGAATLDDIYAAYERVTGGGQISIDYAKQIQAQGFSYAQVAGQNVFAGNVIPSFGEGGLMDHDGLAFLHAGETVNKPGQGGGNITVNVNGPIYGVDDLRDTILNTVRQARQAGGFRGVLAAGR